jgi:hypothetical protein
MRSFLYTSYNSNCYLLNLSREVLTRPDRQTESVYPASKSEDRTRSKHDDNDVILIFKNNTTTTRNKQQATTATITFLGV